VFLFGIPGITKVPFGKKRMLNARHALLESIKGSMCVYTYICRQEIYRQIVLCFFANCSFSRICCYKSIYNYSINSFICFYFVGDVVLTNLKIRENALDDLDLPVQLIYGYLGK